MVSYTVKQDGVAVDLVLWRRWGRRGQSAIGETLALNPGLAELGPILPLGTTFFLPDSPIGSDQVDNSGTAVSLFD